MGEGGIEQEIRGETKNDFSPSGKIQRNFGFTTWRKIFSQVDNSIIVRNDLINCRFDFFNFQLGYQIIQFVNLTNHLPSMKKIRFFTYLKFSTFK